MLIGAIVTAVVLVVGQYQGSEQENKRIKTCLELGHSIEKCLEKPIKK